jgi:hypothetical protein
MKSISGGISDSVSPRSRATAFIHPLLAKESFSRQALFGGKALLFKDVGSSGFKSSGYAGGIE